MGLNTKIEWCNHTHNLWWGCTKVHRGCDNCYAELWADRWGKNIWGNANRRELKKNHLTGLEKLQRKAFEQGAKHTVFVGSMMDIFEKSRLMVDHKGEDYFVETGAIREQFFNNISSGMYPNLIFLLLTKRPSNINKCIPELWRIKGAPDNVWFGTSPVDQSTFDNLVPMLLRVNGKRFLSIEPQLSRINIRTQNVFNNIHWIIQGGESGPKRRPP